MKKHVIIILLLSLLPIVPALLVINSRHAGCTIAVTHGAASADGRVCLLKNRDSTPLMAKLEQVVVIKSESESQRTVLAVGLRGDGGYPEGVNDAGLAAAGSYVFPGEVGLRGAPPRVILRRILEKCSTVDEAIALIKSSRRRFGQNLMLADRTGRAALVEYTPSKVKVIHIRNKTAARANHHIALSSPQKRKPGKSSGLRYKRMKTLIEAKAGALDVETLIAISRDRHRGNSKNSIDNTATEFSTVIVPDPEFPASLSMVWAAIGRPATTPFLPIYMGEDVPDEFEDGAAWRIFRKLQNDRETLGRLLEIEKQALAESKTVEQKARELLRQGKRREAEMLLGTLTEKYARAYASALKPRYKRKPTALEGAKNTIVTGFVYIVTKIF